MSRRRGRHRLRAAPTGLVHPSYVFKLYSQQLALTPDECPLCGPNVFPAFAAVQAFSKLRNWRVAIAVEVPVVKPYACVSDSTADLAERAIDNVAAQGGAVAYLAMDEPLASAASCGYETARFQSFSQSATGAFDVPLNLP